MVGTAFWWTKEEAERDAEETGLPIVGLGRMTGAAPAEQHQGEPVAVLYANGTVLTKADCGDVFDICCKVETPLYTHADTAEVERLREVEDAYKALEGMVELAAKAVGDNTGLMWLKVQTAFLRDLPQLRAQLAEAQALLHAVPAMPASVDRRPNDEDQPDGYLEGDRSWCDNNKDVIEWLIENHAAIRAALSASAEPSALPDPLGCNECTHAECGRFDGPRQVECRAMADNACARPGASS